MNHHFRLTYAQIDLSALEHNIKSLIKHYSHYEHHFAVVKADCYGHGAIECTRVALEAGCDYLCVATLDEALELREAYKDAPILCLGIINPAQMRICSDFNITVTLSSLEYVQSMPKDVPLKAHLKINTGMNRLGFSDSETLRQAIESLKDSNIELEGIYTHIYQADSKELTEAQFKKFEEITSFLNLSDFKYVHVGASEATEFFTKRPYANACRLGISMYGLVDYPGYDFENTFKLVSEVVQINEVDGGTLGYNGAYKIEGHERIAVVPIGYADGVIRKNTGRNVYINDKPYPIVGNVCMDMLFVKVDDSVKIHDKVFLLRDNKHIKETAKHLDTITYEVICSVSKRVPRIYVQKFIPN